MPRAVTRSWVPEGTMASPKKGAGGDVAQRHRVKGHRGDVGGDATRGVNQDVGNLLTVGHAVLRSAACAGLCGARG